jgi:hypothetical protein
MQDTAREAGGREFGREFGKAGGLDLFLSRKAYFLLPVKILTDVECVQCSLWHLSQSDAQRYVLPALTVEVVQNLGLGGENRAERPQKVWWAAPSDD